MIQGSKQQEQVELLNFVKQNNQTLKEIPTIILGNKVDEPDDPEKMALVLETSEKVQEIFGPSCSEDSLSRLLKGKQQSQADKQNLVGPYFIPISAFYAFMYRQVSHMTPETFQSFDQNIIDRIGREEVGRGWKKLSNFERLRVIQRAVGDQSSLIERLESTNFGNFMKTLGFLVGNDKAQRMLLSKQIDVALGKLESDEKPDITESIHQIYKKCNAIDSRKDLSSVFWRAYNACKDRAYSDMEKNVTPEPLAIPFKELCKYYELTRALAWIGEDKLIRNEMKALVQHQLSFLLQQYLNWSFSGFRDAVKGEGLRKFCGSEGKVCSRYPDSSSFCRGSYSYHGTTFYCGMQSENIFAWEKRNEITWLTLSPHDWVALLSSALLPSSEFEIYGTFGLEKTQLEEIVAELRHRYFFWLY